MGLDYSYLLYFKLEHIWDALQGIVAIAEAQHPPTLIHFPDHILTVPLESWIMQDKKIHHDDPEFSFSIVLNFEEDEVIQDYIDSRDRGKVRNNFQPIDVDGSILVPIGYICLTIYNDLSQRIHLDKPSDLDLFDFGTTGTRMSMLFNYSMSIRNTFAGLLDRCHGLCGVFNREEDGELFWVNGRRCFEFIEDPYLAPQEIQELSESYP